MRYFRVYPEGMRARTFSKLEGARRFARAAAKITGKPVSIVVGTGSTYREIETFRP